MATSYGVSGTEVCRVSEHMLEARVSGPRGWELALTPTQITGILADLAALDHKIVVDALIKALRDERASDEGRVGALWLVLQRVEARWLAERVKYPTTPASTRRSTDE